MQFNPSEVILNAEGLTGLGCLATPEQASKHGVYVRGDTVAVKRILQKPSVESQQKAGAIDSYGQSVLDIGVINFDASIAAKILEIFGCGLSQNNMFELSGNLGGAIIDYGLDLYREICCGMGTEVTKADYIENVISSGSKWPQSLLGELFESCKSLPFNLQTLSRCDFLHFGTSRQLITSGNSLIARDRGSISPKSNVEINNFISDSASIVGSQYWIEGCKIDSNVTLNGHNLLVGTEVNEPLLLPECGCLDCMPASNDTGEPMWFVRIYGIDDTFKQRVSDGAIFCNIAMTDWLKMVNANEGDIWPGKKDPAEQTVFEAKLFPIVKNHDEYRDWLWMLDPQKANDSQIASWHKADRYSLSEMMSLSDNDSFFENRESIRALEIKQSLRKMFRLTSDFSAEDLKLILSKSKEPHLWVAAILDQAHWYSDADVNRGIESLTFSRIIHTLGSALNDLFNQSDKSLLDVLPNLDQVLTVAQKTWLSSIGLEIERAVSVKSWSERACDLAFQSLETTIISSGAAKSAPPRNALRADEIVWGRSPARFDTGGGWTDTPPYSLEHGGTVVNTAVDLNGQPPIQAYAKVIDEPVIRIGSIDLGSRIEITELDELLDYRKAESDFALAKVAIALCGFSPESASWPAGIKLKQMMQHFGGGIEVTTLAAIPKGSGLGTSSIVGAVLIAVIKRVMGQSLTQRELFNAVLRLEQTLTTGGGWQDQIGGAVGGSKIISTSPGLIPDARIHYLPTDVLDPSLNGGRSLLYYTGITRLAKNILGKVVGKYLNRQRNTLATLQQIESSASQVAEAMSRKDLKSFGHLVDHVWHLNNQLDPDSTNPAVEQILTRIRPYIYGAKLLGAGGGGFMLMIAKSESDVAKIKEMLEHEPPNKLARFFDYSINSDGLVVTVS